MDDTNLTTERELPGDEAEWRAERDAAEAHLQRLMDTYCCIHCESPNTENVTSEYDAVQVRHCIDCGERYANEF